MFPTAADRMRARIQKGTKMKRLTLIAALSLPAAATADVSGMALRIRCASLVSATNGDMPITNSVNDYFKGMLDGIAIARGATVPSQLPQMWNKVITACRKDPGARIYDVIKPDLIAD